MVAVVERTGCLPRVVPIIREDQPKDTEMLQAFFDRGLGGINFRDDSRLERVCRAIGAFGIAPVLVSWTTAPLVLGTTRRHQRPPAPTGLGGRTRQAERGRLLGRLTPFHERH